jgi:hypothetical protein
MPLTAVAIRVSCPLAPRYAPVPPVIVLLPLGESFGETREPSSASDVTVGPMSDDFDLDDIALQFPERLRFWRIVFRTERVFGRLPVLIVTPAVVSLFATVWAVSHPSEVERHSVVALVPQSFGDVLVNALFGGFVAVLAVAGAVSLAAWAWYRLAGDPTWTADYAEVVTPGDAYKPLMFFELRCSGPIPVDPRSLGAVAAHVMLPFVEQDLGLREVKAFGGRDMTHRQTPCGPDSAHVAEGGAWALADSLVRAQRGAPDSRTSARPREGERRSDG